MDSVKKVYKMGKNEVIALRGVSFKITQGEFVSIFRPSGSGKTTLLMLMAAIIKPTSGRILYDELDISRLDPPKFQFVVATFYLSPYPL